MSTTDKVIYLNPAEAPLMSGALAKAVDSLPAKFQKAPAKEWINTLKSLVSKGLVKQAEIDDNEIVTWLNTRTEKSIERATVLSAIRDRDVTIKEVTLGSPMYQSFSHAALVPGATYNEVLFIANSQRANVEDRIEEIDWELEQFNFDIGRLSEDPDALFRLTDERAALLVKASTAYEFKWTHFVRQDLGRHGKNLIVHAREMHNDKTFLVEEIQSDWGQRGRMSEWREIQRGPFVTDTKLWAGLAMRRMMQRAAMLPNIERFYWIRGSMRNGGRQVTKDNLDEFYLKVMSGIVDKVLAPTGQKCRLDTLRMGDTAFADVPCFDMTPEVREALRKTLPLYSLSDLLPRPRVIADDEKAALMASATRMLGSAKNVRLVSHVYDIALGREVAGSYINGMVQTSLRAADLPGVLDHECFHFGMEKLFSMEERRVVEAAFAPGAELNTRIRRQLERAGDHTAARQCDEAEEAAAYAFAAWSQGRFSVAPGPVQGLFQSLRDVVAEGLSWFRRVVLQEQAKTVEQVFEAFARGDYAQRGAKMIDKDASHREVTIRREAVRG